MAAAPPHVERVSHSIRTPRPYRPSLAAGVNAVARGLYLLLAVLVALMGLAFHVRNKQTIVLDYFAGTVNVELSLVVVGALVLGAVLGALAMGSALLGLKTEVRRLKRRQQIAGRELASLRAIAAKDVT